MALPYRSRRTVGSTSRPKLTGNAKAFAVRQNRRQMNTGTNPGRGFGPGTTRVPAGRPGLAPKPGPGAPKPGPAPEARAAAAPQPATMDSRYFDQIDRVGRRQEHALAQLGNQEADIKRDYGIEDPTDPFSRANGLKRAFLARQKAASTSLASQGQLYSGAHERALTRTRREEEQARHDLRQSYEAAINQIGAAKAGVKFGSEEERAQAFEDWLARAPEAADEPLSEEEIEGPNALAAANEPESQAPTRPPQNARDAALGAPIPAGGGKQQKTTGEEMIRGQRQAKRKTAAQRERDRRQAERQKQLARTTVGVTGKAQAMPGSGGANKAAPSRQLRSYVKNGWFYRESSTQPGRMLRIRRASGR